MNKIINWYRKFMKPSRFIQGDSKIYYQKRILSEYRELLIIDAIIIVFLLASAHQLAYFFEGGPPAFWSWIKALGFDGAIALFSRNVSRAAVLKERSRGTWTALIFLMLITIFCNLGYEWLRETGGIGEEYIVRDYYKNIRGFLISGSLAIIILGMSAVRSLAARSFEERRVKYQRWQVEEERKIKVRERQKEYYREKNSRKQRKGKKLL